MTKFKTWLDSIVDLTGPIADEVSLKWVICNEVMRLSTTKDKVPKAYFVKVLRKYAANQLAASSVNEIKMQQAEAQAKLKQAEDTAKETQQNGQAPVQTT